MSKLSRFVICKSCKKRVERDKAAKHQRSFICLDCQPPLFNNIKKENE